jgi:hypothetical protein
MAFILSEINEEDIVISVGSNGKPYSKYSDDNWFISGFEFDVSFSRLSGKFKDIVKQLVYSRIREASLKSCKSSVKNIIDGSVVFEKCLYGCGKDSYSYLDDDYIFRLVLDKAKARRIKYKTWKNYLIFITALQSNGFINRNIDSPEKLARYLSGNIDDVRQTLCLPENIASTYYGNALQIVEKYHSLRHDISDSYSVYVGEYERYHQAGYTTFTCNKYALRKVVNLSDIEYDYTGRWLSWLRGACYIVLAAFTGCRDGEIKSFTSSSYEEKQYGSVKIPILKGTHTKVNVGGVERTTSWVTVPCAAKAIELLWDSFEFARKIWKRRSEHIEHVDDRKRFLSDIDSLFITLPFTTANKPKAGRQALASSLRNFVKSVGYKLTRDDVNEFELLNPSRKKELKVGEYLIPHPHSFRRTFAVFLVRNKLGSLLDLKYQFKHMNIAMTSWYSNQAHVASYFDMMMDSELQAEIADENHAYITDTLYYIYNEADTLAGPEGKRILDLRKASDTQIYLSRSEISSQVKEGRLSIIEHPSGHCTNPSCNRVCDMTTCQFKVVTKEKALELVSMRERFIGKFQAMSDAKVNQPNILSNIYYQIRSIEKVFDEHSISYSRFSGDISASLL